MDIEYSELKDRLTINLDSDDVREISEKHKYSRESNKLIRGEFVEINIHYEDEELKGKENPENKPYDDVLDALQEAYDVLKYLFENGGDKEMAEEYYEIERIFQTYAYYKQIQRRYRWR